MDIHDKPSLEGIERFLCIALLAQAGAPYTSIRRHGPNERTRFYRFLRLHYAFEHSWVVTPDDCYQEGHGQILWDHEPIWEFRRHGTCLREARAMFRVGRELMLGTGKYLPSSRVYTDDNSLLNYRYRSMFLPGNCTFAEFQQMETLELLDAGNPASGFVAGTYTSVGKLLPSSFTQEPSDPLAQPVKETSVVPILRIGNANWRT